MRCAEGALYSAKAQRRDQLLWGRNKTARGASVVVPAGELYQPFQRKGT